MTQVKGAASDQSAYTPYVPVYSTDIGNAAASFTGGLVTTTVARALQQGKRLELILNFNALTIAVTPAYIKVSLPAGVLSVSSSPITPAVIKIGATWETGMMIHDVTGFVRFYRANQVAFPAGTTFQCAICTTVETQ